MKYFIVILLCLNSLLHAADDAVLFDNIEDLEQWYVSELQKKENAEIAASEVNSSIETPVAPVVVENNETNISTDVIPLEQTVTTVTAVPVPVTVESNLTEVTASVDLNLSVHMHDLNKTAPIVIVKYYGDGSSQELCNSLSKEYIDFWNLLDLTLINATAMIMKKHDIKITEENMEIVRSQYYPNLSIGYGGEYYHGFSRTAQTSVGGKFYPSTSDFRDSLSLSANHELYHFGATDLKVQMAEKDIEIVKSELALRAEETSKRLLQYYTSALRMQDTINFKEKMLDVQNRILEKKERMYRAGEATKMSISKDQLSIIGLKKEISQAKINRLQAIKNIEMLANISIDSNRSKFAMLEPRNTKIKTFEESAEARNLKLKIEQKVHELELTRKEYLPTIYTNADYVMLGSDKALFEAIKGLEKNSWNVGINVTWNLFNGYKTNKTIDKIKYELRKLTDQYHLAKIEFEAKEEQRKTLEKSIDEVLKIESELFEQTCQQGEMLSKLHGAGFVDNLQVDYVEVSKLKSELDFRLDVIDKVYQKISSELIQ